MKRIMSIMMVVALMAMAMVLPSQAASQEIQREIEEYGEFRIETILTVHDSMARSSTKVGEKTKNYYFGDELIATVTFKVTFGYDGSDAWVNSTSVSKSTSGGWSYGGQSIDKDGNTATLTAKLSNVPHKSINVEITMTCSPSGKIS